MTCFYGANLEKIRNFIGAANSYIYPAIVYY